MHQYPRRVAFCLSQHLLRDPRILFRTSVDAANLPPHLPCIHKLCCLSVYPASPLSLSLSPSFCLTPISATLSHCSLSLLFSLVLSGDYFVDFIFPTPFPYLYLAHSCLSFNAVLSHVNMFHGVTGGPTLPTSFRSTVGPVSGLHCVHISVIPAGFA